jgi:PKD repeat protein
VRIDDMRRSIIATQTNVNDMTNEQNATRIIETNYLTNAFRDIMCTQFNVAMTSCVVAYDDEIIRVRVNDDDEYTFACACTNDDDEYEFHHASFDDRFIVRIAIMNDDDDTINATTYAQMFASMIKLRDALNDVINARVMNDDAYDRVSNAMHDCENRVLNAYEFNVDDNAYRIV